MKRSIGLGSVLALVPAGAWAHGDHSGASSVAHLLASPENFAVLLAIGVAAGLLRRAPARFFKRLWNTGP